MYIQYKYTNRYYFFCFTIQLYKYTEYQLRNLRHLREPQVHGILSSSNGNL